MDCEERIVMACFPVKGRKVRRRRGGGGGGRGGGVGGGMIRRFVNCWVQGEVTNFIAFHDAPLPSSSSSCLNVFDVMIAVLVDDEEACFPDTSRGRVCDVVANDICQRWNSTAKGVAHGDVGDVVDGEADEEGVRGSVLVTWGGR